MTENEDLKQKKLVRGGHRAYATKILGQAKGLLVDYEDDSEATLLQYKATLEKRVKILEQLDEEIFGLTKAEEINAEPLRKQVLLWKVSRRFFYESIRQSV